MIRRHMKMMDGLTPRMPDGLTSPYRQLIEHGRSFTPAPLKGFRKMKDKECFRNSAMTAMDHGLIYCEGFAIPDGILIPIHHAWVVGSDGVVIDRTWKNGVEYFGIPFDEEYVMDAMIFSETWGIMFNHLYRPFLAHTAEQFIYKGSIDNASSTEESQPYQASAVNFTGGGFVI